MSEDRLTHSERVRLEAFNQISTRHVSRPVSFQDHCAEAEQLVAWMQIFNPQGSPKATILDMRAKLKPQDDPTVVTVSTDEQTR